MMRSRSAALGIAVMFAIIGVGAACGSTYAEAPPDASSAEAGGGDGPGDVADGASANDATDAPSGSTATTLASGYAELAGIFATETTVYFVDPTKGGIHSVPMAGGAVSDIFMSGASPSGIVVSGDDLFWTDYGHKLLNHVLISSGTNQSVSPAAKAPIAIAIAGSGLVLASLGVGDVGDVQQYQLDLTVAGPSIGGQQNPLDVAAYQSEVFWTESSAGNIRAATVGADDVMLLASGESDCESIAADGAGVYWTRPGEGLVRAILSGGSPRTIAPAESSPFSLAADDSGVYWLTKDGRLRRSSRNELPITTIAAAFGGSPANDRIQAIALTSKYVVWLTADGKVLRADK